MRIKKMGSLLVWGGMFICLAVLAVVGVKGIPEQKIAMVAVIGVISVAGAYLTLDFSAVISTTKARPAGDFKEADLGKYLAMILGLLVLLVLAVVLFIRGKIGLENPIALILGGLYGILVVVVGGLKLNKKETREPGKTEGGDNGAVR